MADSGILNYIQQWDLNIEYSPISIPNKNYKEGGLTKSEKLQRKNLKPTPSTPPAVSQEEDIVGGEHQLTQTTKPRVQRE